MRSAASHISGTTAPVEMLDFLLGFLSALSTSDAATTAQSRYRGSLTC